MPRLARNSKGQFLKRNRHRARIRHNKSRRRRNPGLAEYLLNKPRHRKKNPRVRHAVKHRVTHRINRHRNPPARHYRRRRNPGLLGGVALPEAFKNPTGYLVNGGTAFLGVYWAVTGGNFVLGYVYPSALTATDYVSRAVKYGSRIAVAWLGDMGLKAMKVSANVQQMYRIGCTIGVVGGFLFDFLGKGFVLGSGDTAQNPGYALSGLNAYMYAGRNLRGAGAYHLDRAAHGVRGTGAYLTARRLRGLAAMDVAAAGLGGAHRLYGGSWRADG